MDILSQCAEAYVGFKKVYGNLSSSRYQKNISLDRYKTKSVKYDRLHF
jgi:hypothetical protein